MFSIFVTASFLSVTATALVFKYSKSIFNYAIKFLDNRPGQGEILKKRRDYFIKTKNENIKLNYIRSPTFDINVSYFLDVDDLIIGKYPKEEFLEKTKNLRRYNLMLKGTGVIEDVYRTTKIKKGSLYGYVDSFTEDSIYVFEIKEGMIDLRKVFNEFEEIFL